MSDDNPNTTPTDSTPPADDKPTDKNPSIEDLQRQLDEARADAEKWKSHSRKHEDRAKDNADKAKRFDELEEQNKSEAEKLQARAEKAEKELADARAEAMRSRIAAEKGVPLDLVNLLTGSDEESIAAAADALLEFRGSTPKAPPADAQGQRGGESKPKQLTRADLKGMSPDAIQEARAAGQLHDLMSGAGA